MVELAYNVYMGKWNHPGPRDLLNNYHERLKKGRCVVVIVGAASAAFGGAKPALEESLLLSESTPRQSEVDLRYCTGCLFRSRGCRPGQFSGVSAEDISVVRNKLQSCTHTCIHLQNRNRLRECLCRPSTSELCLC